MNKEKTLLVISSYPPKGTTYGPGVGGVASFAKNSLQPLAQNGRKIVVLAEILRGKETYEENGLLVVRCWQRNHPGNFWELFQRVMAFKETDQILVQFEFALFGELVVTGLLPFFLLALRLAGKKVFLVTHQVLTNLDSLSGHLGLAKGSIRLNFYSFLTQKFYWFLSLGSQKIIVLEREFEKRLWALGIAPSQVTTVYHGVDQALRLLPQAWAKRKLGIAGRKKMVLFFGFQTWYKGADLAVEGFRTFLRESQTEAKLILAGGQSPTQKNKPHYQKFYTRLLKMVEKDSHIQVTGFVPEKEVATYFSAADLVILPYRTFMSSSGPLSLALSFEKPVLLSAPLKKWFSNGQARFLLQEDFFEPNTAALAKALTKVLGRQNKLAKLAAISRQIKTLRDYKTLASQYGKILDEEKNIDNNYSGAWPALATS